jgi:hypothetical protein
MLTLLLASRQVNKQGGMYPQVDKTGSKLNTKTLKANLIVV